MELSIVGTGYVGLVTGTCLAEVGHQVRCIDNDTKKIEMLKAGRSPIFERDLETLIQRNMGHDRITFSTDLAEAVQATQVCFIAVGTPESEDGSADLKYVVAVARGIGQTMTRRMLVVVKSTVPPGTCDLVEKTIRDALLCRSVEIPFAVASNPEFLKEGMAVDDFMRPDRIVVGVADPYAIDVFREIYAPFVTDDPARLIFMDRRSSELTKYVANCMLATRISFMNEISRLCERLGADIDLVRLGIGSDPRIGKKFLYAGPGYGGSCFPKDVAALIHKAKDVGVELEVLDATTSANKKQKQLLVDKVKRHFGSIYGKRIAVWGLAFKPGTDDVRESPALTIVAELIRRGAEVVAHDPQVREHFARVIGDYPALRYVDDAYDALQDADAVVLITEWPEYKRPNWSKAKQMMRIAAVFDGRNQYRFGELNALGFHYECIGRIDSSNSCEVTNEST